MTVIRAVAALREANEIGWRIKPDGRIDENQIRRTRQARESMPNVTLTEQESPQRCALCGLPAAKVLPMPRPNVDDDPRPGVPLCVGHRREWIGGAPVVGWCPGGTGHYGRQSTRCAEHGLFFTDPLA